MIGWCLHVERLSHDSDSDGIIGKNQDGGEK